MRFASAVLSRILASSADTFPGAPITRYSSVACHVFTVLRVNNNVCRKYKDTRLVAIITSSQAVQLNIRPWRHNGGEAVAHGWLLLVSHNWILYGGDPEIEGHGSSCNRLVGTRNWRRYYTPDSTCNDEVCPSLCEDDRDVTRMIRFYASGDD